MIVLLLLLFLEVKNGWRIGAVSLQRVLHSSKSIINRGHTFSKQVCLVISLLCHWACEKALLLGVIASWHTRPARERRHSLARSLAKRNEELFHRLCASKVLNSSSVTLHIFVFFLRCSQPENTNVYLTCVAGGFLCFVKQEIQRRESWTEVETKRWGRGRGRRQKSHAFSPRLFPRHFLFRPRFSFRAVLSLTLRNTTVEAHQKTVSYAG